MYHMKIKFKTFAIICFALLSSFCCIPLARVQAAGDGLGKIDQLEWGLHKAYKGGVKDKSPEFINALLNFATGVAAVWLLFVIIASGIKIIYSARSPEDFTAQMKKIMWSCLGMVVVALSYVIVTWLLKTFFGEHNLIDNPVEKIMRK